MRSPLELFFQYKLYIYVYTICHYITSGNEEYTCNAAVDTASSLRHLVYAVRGVAATSSNSDNNVALLVSAKDVLDKSGLLLEEASRAIADPHNKDNQARLAQVYRGSLWNCYGHSNYCGTRLLDLLQCMQNDETYGMRAHGMIYHMLQHRLLCFICICF